MLKVAEQQYAWLIATSLIHKEKKFGNLAPTNIITGFLGSLDKGGLKVLSNALSVMKDGLLENKKISKDDGKKVNQLIQAGILENEEIHKLYLDRA